MNRITFPMLMLGLSLAVDGCAGRSGTNPPQ